eukprot:CAMPEP_0115871564 /NCGR_PEP_ID=MMETSP0287-20121206/22942_1 /TAXON_ID=412157 /ORGANISM="Chrysochromulina rotalis, Strain UIO044" /LENGTH=119 /DNA_ID=CAMNT_0003326391 /DNA_START=239 /DNA_END=597 /DNA_ORIENTATION=+
MCVGAWAEGGQMAPSDAPSGASRLNIILRVTSLMGAIHLGGEVAQHLGGDHTIGRTRRHTEGCGRRRLAWRLMALDVHDFAKGDSRHASARTSKRPAQAFFRRAAQEVGRATRAFTQRD